MRWLLILAAASLPLLGIACSDPTPNETPKETPKASPPEDPPAKKAPPIEKRELTLTYFTIPG